MANGLSPGLLLRGPGKPSWATLVESEPTSPLRPPLPRVCLLSPGLKGTFLETPASSTKQPFLLSPSLP